MIRFTTASLVITLDETIEFDELYLTFFQNGKQILELTKEDPNVFVTVTEPEEEGDPSGTEIAVDFTQEQSGLFSAKYVANVQINGTSGSERYATYMNDLSFSVSENKKNEVI